MHLFIGSTNPVKINAVIAAASETWPGVVVQGYAVESGIAPQPMSDEETRRGAETRARAALEKGLEDDQRDPSTSLEFHSGFAQDDNHVIGVGLEGGVFANVNGELWNTVWVSVADTTGNIVSANGERFQLPKILADRIRAGEEMGPAMDRLIGSVDIKQTQGMIGVITHGFIDRTQMYTGLAKLTLGLWYGRKWVETLGGRV